MAAKKSISLRNILAALGTLLLFIGYITYHANFVLGRTLTLAFPNWDVSYRSGWPNPLGGAFAKDVEMVAMDGSGETFHFDRVSVHIPFFQYYRSAFSTKRGALIRSVHDFRIELRDGHGDVGMPIVDSLALFGNVDAAPFDAEGCLQDQTWTEDELQAMGLKAQGVNLTLEQHATFGHWVMQETLDAPGVGWAESRRQLSVFGKVPLFNPNAIAARLTDDEWHVKDAGFVAARNAHCAARDKTDVDTFVQRHLRSVKRLLAVTGVAPTSRLETAYRDYARAGGTLDVVVHYDPPIDDDLAEATELSAWLPSMQGQISVNGQPQALAFEAITPRPLPDSEEDMSTFELVQREEGTEPNNVTQPPAPATPSTASASPAAHASLAPVIVASAAPSAPSNVPATRTASPAASAHDAAFVTPVVADTDIHYEQLNAFVGKRLTIHQHGQKTYDAQIVRVAKNGVVTARRKYPSGYLEFTLDRRQFEYAEP